MAKDIWLISDHHLSHANILTFKDKHECFIRPEFDNIKDMNAFMLEAHNKVVKPQDDVYFLGDVLFGSGDDKTDAMNTLRKMQGYIHLAPGNHDNILQLVSSYYSFREVRLWYKLSAGGKKIIANHCPLNSWDIRRCDINAHGHIHEKSMGDPRYVNVCVEQLGYEPIHIEDLVALAG